MQGMELLVLLGLICGSFAAALGALWTAALIERRRDMRQVLSPPDGSQAIFLFDDEHLANATPAGHDLLSCSGGSGSDWDRLCRVLVPRFPDFVERMSHLVDLGQMQLASPDGRSRLTAEWRAGLARISVQELDRDGVADAASNRALQDELSVLRGIVDKVPYMTWKEAGDGSIVWANAAYLDAAERMQADTVAPAWPPPRLFPAPGAGDAQPLVPVGSQGRHAASDTGGRLPASDNLAAVGLATAGEGKSRHRVVFAGDAVPSWFELRDIEMPGGTLRVALPVDAQVEAEQSRAALVQTLTRTFASLTVGLAIFDRRRRLVLFNPALADLTGMAPEFLALRPSLESVLDRLREARMLPEPRDFAGWRQKMLRLEHEAETGTYAETWTLPDGQVFEVTGRPYPDGAIAFLFKDISSEIRLTRRFRADLEIHQSVLDSLTPAIAVFDMDGALLLANDAYCRMWRIDPRTATQQVTLQRSMRSWRRDCPTCAGWEMLHQDGAPRRIAFQARRITGEQVEVRFQRLVGGVLMVSFDAGSRSGDSASKSEENDRHLQHLI